MYSFLQERLQRAVRSGEIGLLILLLGGILLVAFTQMYVSALVFQYIWNTRVIEILSWARPMTVMDILVLRFAYFAFHFIS